MSRNSMQVADSISTMEDVDERSRWYLKIWTFGAMTR